MKNADISCCGEYGPIDEADETGMNSAFLIGLGWIFGNFLSADSLTDPN